MFIELKYGLIILLLPLLLQLAGLLFAVAIDPYITEKQQRTMLMIICAVFCLVAQNIISYCLEYAEIFPRYRTISDIAGYCIRPVVIALFCYLVDDKRKNIPAWILAGINALIFLSALKFKVAFWIDEKNNFHRGPLGYTAHIISGILLAYLVYLTLHQFSTVRRTDFWIPILNAVSIVAAVIMDSVVEMTNYPVTYLTITIVSSCVFYYIWLHLQYVREHENALRAEQRIQIMMSQIQPHFLYNTLATIQALCRTDPNRAAEVTERFGTYLRQNLDSLTITNRIPLAKELEHTEAYTEIERVRFPYLRIVYDIQDESFTLPALTIQPLVENAIRHGVRGKENGLVTVSTRQESGEHILEIRDNGKGFDPEKPPAGSGGAHIGLKNVEERIRKMCYGTMTVTSAPGEGCDILIRIPS